MADWSELRSLLRSTDDRVTIPWTDLERLVGGLPRSATQYPAFWSGDRSGWPGFRTTDVRVGQAVTFVRRTEDPGKATASPKRIDREDRARPTFVDLVLVGCAKSKLDHPEAARKLYTSALFRKARDYAESRAGLWFILSAEHGLIPPDEIVAPYDRQLSDTSVSYREDWGRQVVESLRGAAAPLRGKNIEIHAGILYADAIRDLLVAEGATVLEPLHGLTMGRRLAWYADLAKPAALARLNDEEIASLVAELRDEARARTPAAFLQTDGAGLRSPGLYSWFVDHRGATELQAGLGSPVEPGLIYAGLAGATRSRSGKKSKNTLWGRVRGMHLGGRHELSTFRLSLGAILTEARGATEINEEGLTAWMHDHLAVVAVPVGDPDLLDQLETAVLDRLDPLLNLNKMAKTEARRRLSELRRRHGTRSRRRSQRSTTTDAADSEARG